MAQELGVGYVSIVPSGKGFGKAIEGDIDTGVARGTARGESRVAGFFARWSKRAALAGTAVVAAFSIRGGISRLLAIDDAEGKLRGLGFTAKEIAVVMDSALASVRGTAFGLGDAATTAATAVAAGIKPGKELTKYLKTVADTATIAGGSLSEIGSIINKTTTSGRVFTDDLNQLADRGLPVFTWLQKEYKVSATELRKMVEKGQIDSKRFRKILNENIGGAALESGNTVRGALANLGASLGRIGANLLSPIFERIGPGAQALTQRLGAVEAVATRLGDKLSGALANTLPRIADGFSALASAGSSKAVAGIADSVGSLVDAVRAAASTVAPTLVKIVDALKPWVSLGVDVAARAFAAAVALLGPTLKVTAKALSAIVSVAAPVVKFLGKNRSIVVGLAVAYATWKTYLLLTAAAGWAVYLWQSRAVILGATQIALTKGMAAAQLLFNTALRANPIGLVITAIAGLAAGLIYAYKHSEAFRNIVNAVFTWIKTFVPAAISFVIEFVKNHWGLLVSIFGGPIGAVAVLVIKNFDKIKAAFRLLWGAVTVGIGYFRSFYNGVAAFIGKAIDKVKGIHSAITGAFAKAGTWLVDIGRKIIQGLINGIKDKFNDVKNTLGDLTSKLTSWKGPESRDRLLLRPAGHWVIEGFIAGIDDRQPAVRGALSGVTDMVGAFDVSPLGVSASLVGGPDAAGGSSASEVLARIHPSDIRDIIQGLYAAVFAGANGVANQREYDQLVTSRMPGAFAGGAV